VHPLLNPLLNLVQPVVAFRQDMRQPDQARSAKTCPSPIAMRQEMLIQKFWNPDFLALRQQYWNIVHLFRRYLEVICHADSLSHFSMSVKI